MKYIKPFLYSVKYHVNSVNDYAISCFILLHCYAVVCTLTAKTSVTHFAC